VDALGVILVGAGGLLVYAAYKSLSPWSMFTSTLAGKYAPTSLATGMTAAQAATSAADTAGINKDAQTTLGNAGQISPANLAGTGVTGGTAGNPLFIGGTQGF
jgi:hypothetical protein